MKTKEEILPKGWRSNEFNERMDAIKLLPKRVRVLLTVEWARSVIRIYDEKYTRDDRPLKAIEAAENWVKTPNAAATNAANAAAAAYAANAAAYAANAAAYAADAAAYAADAAAYAANAAAYAAGAADAAAYATNATNAADAAAKWKWLYKTYKYCKGQVSIFDDSWKTDTCIALARNIYDTRDCSSMPILADALQDAGCDCDDMLNHLRHDSENWTRACWVIWNLLELGNDL